MSKREDLFRELSEKFQGKNEKEIDPVKTWTSLFEIARDETSYLSIFNPLIQQFILESDYKIETTPEIKNAIECFLDNQKEVKEREEQLIPLMSLIQYLMDETILKIFDGVACVIKKHVEEYNEIPEKILNILETADMDAISPETLGLLMKNLVGSKEKDDFEYYVLGYSPIAAELIDDDNDQLKFLINVVHDGLNGDRMKKISALILLKYIAPQIAGNKEFLQKDMFSILSSNFLEKDEVICLKAHKAMRKLIEYGIYDNIEEVLVVIKQFPEYPEEKYPLFFKLLQRFLDDYQNPKLRVVQAIYAFIEDSFNKGSNFIKGKCLELLSQIAAINKIYVEDIYEEALEIAIKLLGVEKRCFTEITNFFLAVSKLFPETLSKIIDLLGLLTDSLTDESTGTIKQRMERAESIATIIQNGSCFGELIEKVTEFTISTLDIISGNELFYVCSVILALREQLNQQTANIIYGKLEKLARNEKSSPKLNAILHTMKKLMKSFKIDATDFVQSLLIGDIKFLGGFPLYTCQNEETMIFYFIAAYIRLYPLKSEAICTKLIDIIPLVRSEMIPVILEPLEAGIHLGIVGRDDLVKTYEIIMTSLNSFEISENEEEICACIEILSQIGKSNPDIFNISDVFEILNQLITSVDEDEIDCSQPISSIIRFTLELYTVKNINITINEMLMNLILKILPLAPSISGMDDILELLVEILDDPRFKNFIVKILILISEILMMKKPDLDQYQFRPDLILKLKETLKKHILLDRTIERQIVKTFKNNRQKMNRFNSLLK